MSIKFHKHLFIAVLVMSVALIAGCAEITPPSPNEILESPFGQGQLHIGMTRDEVRDLWGDPDYTEELESGQFGSKRQVWIYEARYPQMAQIDVGYASRTKKLLFDGNHLVSLDP